MRGVRYNMVSPVGTRAHTLDALSPRLRAIGWHVQWYVAPEHLYGCTNCGMAPMARGVAEAKLQSLAAGAAIVRKELGGRK